MVRGGDNRGVRGGASEVGMAGRVCEGSFDCTVGKYICMSNGSPSKRAHAILDIGWALQVSKVLLERG